MKSAIPVIVFVLAGMVTLPQSAPAQPADIIVCSGSNLNCYYAPANIKLPATCFKGADTMEVVLFSVVMHEQPLRPPDLGPAQKQLRAGPPVFGHDRGQKHRFAMRATSRSPPRNAQTNLLPSMPTIGRAGEEIGSALPVTRNRLRPIGSQMI